MVSVGKIAYVGWNKKIFAITEDTVRQFVLPLQQTEYMTNIIAYKNRYYVLSYDFFVETDSNFRQVKKIRSVIPPRIHSGKQLKIANGKMYILVDAFIGEVANGTWSSRPTKTRLPLGRCFEPLHNGQFLYGARDGIWLLTPERDSNLTEYIPGIKQPVSAIMTTKNGQVLVTTKGEGLFLYKDKKLATVNQKFGIQPRILWDIAEDRLGRYWIASNAGLICCSRQGDSVHTTTYTVFDGLPANEIYKLAITPNKGFFSTVFGVSSLPLGDETKDTADPRIFLSSFKVNSKAIPVQKLPHKLAFNENTLQFSFDVLSFKNNHHHIVYCLKGRDEKFLHANTTDLVMENLSPGAYELVVYAQNEKGIKSERPFLYTFYIASPFWWSWWFICAMVLILVVIFIRLVRYFVKRIRKKDEEKNRINTMLAESRLTAIQAQMNPHFVFNAINSIQKYILKNQKEEAYHYLAKFSQLIRMVLNNSQKKMLPLNKELETLKLYVELEQMRFKQAFAFEIRVDECIDEHEVQLPPMLIQPLLENAIWHGLMPMEKSRKGLLLLCFSVEGKQLRIVMEDNGVGREQAGKNKIKPDHQSMALNLVKERLKMVKQLYRVMDEANLNIIDLFDEKGMAAGTRIEIYLPVL